MSDFPLLDELREMCESDKLNDCFKFLMAQEIPMKEASVVRLAEEGDQLRADIHMRTERMMEVYRLRFDDGDCAEAVYNSLNEMQIMEVRLLEAFARLVTQVRAVEFASFYCVFFHYI